MIFLAVILLVVFASIPAPWNVVFIAIACVLEVFEIVLLRRWSKRLDKSIARTTGPEALIGERAEVVQPCRPVGMVQLNGELWEARCEEGADTGETVKVKSLSGLALVVDR